VFLRITGKELDLGEGGDPPARDEQDRAASAERPREEARA